MIDLQATVLYGANMSDKTRGFKPIYEGIEQHSAFLTAAELVPASEHEVLEVMAVRALAAQRRTFTLINQGQELADAFLARTQQIDIEPRSAAAYDAEEHKLAAGYEALAVTDELFKLSHSLARTEPTFWRQLSRGKQEISAAVKSRLDEIELSRRNITESQYKVEELNRRAEAALGPLTEVEQAMLKAMIFNADTGQEITKQTFAEYGVDTDQPSYGSQRAFFVEFFKRTFRNEYRVEKVSRKHWSPHFKGGGILVKSIDQ